MFAKGGLPNIFPFNNVVYFFKIFNFHSIKIGQIISHKVLLKRLTHFCLPSFNPFWKFLLRFLPKLVSKRG